MLNKLFGFGLVAAAMLIGVHSCGDDFSKTNIAITITHAPPVVAEKVAELSDKAMASLELKFKPCPIYSQDVPLPKAKPTVSSKKKSVSKKIYFSKKKVHHVYKFILPNEFKSDMKFSYEQQRHSRSCPESRFGSSCAAPGGHHHHSGGHHHSGPQKISAHGPPTHLTGCSP